MSLRRHVFRVLALTTAVALCFGEFAGVASAKKPTKKQKAAITKKLRKQLKKNPRAITKKSFLKQARFVDFKLPVTIRVRRATNGDPTNVNAPNFTNNVAGVNTATLDLGPSLGTRTLGLGGLLPAQIEFSDSYDGGGLGNVKLDLLSGGEAAGYGLTSTSIPLLTNTDTTTQPIDPNPLNLSLYEGTGCNAWTQAGVDNPALLSSSFNPGNNNLGGGPYSPEAGATAGDAVLRTSSLNLTVANSGVAVPIPGGSVITTGKSGGRANLFGNIPGKSTDIEVTASLFTNINSILREVDATAGGQAPLNILDNDSSGGPSAGDTTDTTNSNLFVAFQCRQAISGSVPNYLTGIRLNGDIKIAPAFTADGKLRIAKATLGLESPARIAVAACLFPYTSYAAFNPTFNPTNHLLGDPNSAPYNPAAAKSIQTGSPYTLPAAYGGTPIPNARDIPCGQADPSPLKGQDPILRSFGVNDLVTPPAPFSTSDDGSQAKVAAELTQLALDVDVLVGANATTP